MEHPEPQPTEDDSGDAHNELDYRNADEEAQYDERGEQGPDIDERGRQPRTAADFDA